jgi:N-acetylneuraminate synthase
MNSHRSITINGRRIGPGNPTYIIAELSANHHGSLDEAARLVQAAAEAGADAIKLQTYTPDTITIDADSDYFRISANTVWDGRTLYELYSEAYTPWEWHESLKRVAEAFGLALFSSPFDASAVDFLSALGVPAFKIASFELVDIGLIQLAARTGKPIIMSTGMGTLDEITEAVGAARSAGARELALLKCTSAYPAPPEEANLRTIPHLADAFDVPTGLSDHTVGAAVPIAAVALGAGIIEKHLTLSRGVDGPDSGFSTEPREFQEMVRGIRAVESALGSVCYVPTDRELASRSLRRSLFIVKDVRQGEVLSADVVRSIRPASGLHTRHLNDVLGRRASRDLKRGTPLTWDAIAAE